MPRRRGMSARLKLTLSYAGIVVFSGVVLLAAVGLFLLRYVPDVQIVAEGMPVRILMLTAADRLDEKVRGFELGADDYITKPFEMRELVMRLRAVARRPAEGAPPTLDYAGLRLDPFRREVYRDDRYVALTRKQFAVLEVLMAARGGVVSAETLLERAWDENADPFTNAVRITISELRKRLGEPWVIQTVAGSGYRAGEATSSE